MCASQLCKKDFTLVCAERMRDNGHKVKQHTFRLFKIKYKAKENHIKPLPKLPLHGHQSPLVTVKYRI